MAGKVQHGTRDGIEAAIAVFGMGVLTKVVADALVAGLKGEQFEPISPQLQLAVIPLGLLVLLIVLLRYSLLLTGPLPRHNVERYPEKKSFSLRDKLLLVPLFHSAVRVTVGCGAAVSLAVLMVGLAFIPSNWLALLMIVVVAGWFVLYWAGYAGIKEVLERSVDQMLVTFCAQMEETVCEALGHDQYRLRCHITLYDQERSGLVPGPCYRMEGEPDCDLIVGPNQCVRGIAFTSRRPHLQSGYDPLALGFSEEQASKMPKIEWMAAFPILDEEDRALGTLGVDCNLALPEEWLDKVKDFGHGMASGMGIVLSLRQRR